MDFGFVRFAVGVLEFRRLRIHVHDVHRKIATVAAQLLDDLRAQLDGGMTKPLGHPHHQHSLRGGQGGYGQAQEQ
ncbi:MAG: hypothetical protein BWX84_00591 [Verrucomicrobia bacterium ADurb.Bin118]|nr:MAG: hypothetical protein BWX84_00591 [Verrucomicrobia bacterium ADurb.Bin118]